MLCYGIAVNNNATASMASASSASPSLLSVDKCIVGIFIPNFDPKPVDSAASVDLAVSGRQHEAIIADTIDGPGTFVLRVGSCNNQPVICRGAELFGSVNFSPYAFSCGGFAMGRRTRLRRTPLSVTAERK